MIIEGGAPRAVAAGTVLATERRRESIRVEAESPGDGILVVNDSFSPGWVATLDGRPWPVWRADFLVRAMPWPAGRHVLEMRYQAPGLRAGIAVSLAGLAAVAALWLCRPQGAKVPVSVLAQVQVFTRRKGLVANGSDGTMRAVILA